MAEVIVVAGALVKDVDQLVEEGDWCLVRYTKPQGQFCGPLSLMTTDPGALFARGFRHAIGFPYGRIGLLKLFTTEAAATACIEEAVGEWEDRVTPMADLHFSLSEYSYWTRMTRVLYDGGDYRHALVGWLVKRGIYTTRDNDGPNRYEANIDCRLVR